MAIITQESRAAHIGRLRRLVTVTKSQGMSVSVRGVELRGIMDAYDEVTTERDEARAEVERLSTRKGKPKSVPVAESTGEDVTGLLLALQDIVQNRPEMWRQPFSESVPAWCAGTGDPVPPAWAEMLANIK